MGSGEVTQTLRSKMVLLCKKQIVLSDFNGFFFWEKPNILIQWLQTLR